MAAQGRECGGVPRRTRDVDVASSGQFGLEARLAAMQQRQLAARSENSRLHDAGSSSHSNGWPALRTFGVWNRSSTELALNDSPEPRQRCKCGHIT
jgi:hypothetical protein